MAEHLVNGCLESKLRLVGERLILRPLVDDDCGERYCSWLNNPEVNTWLETRWATQDLVSIKRFVSLSNGSPDVLLLGIFRDRDELHIGNIKLGPINRHHACADVSYFIGEQSAWGQGYATEAIRLVLKFAFQTLGLHRVQAGCYAANVASTRALLKSGFKAEGTWRKQLKSADGIWQDHLWFGVLAEEWSALT